VDGYDAAAKAAILASLAFHTRVTMSDVHREGIAGVSSSDITAAGLIDRVVKPLAICERVVDSEGGESVSARVHPVMLPRDHQLAGVGGAFNAVYVEADAAGELMFYGQGAGGAPTASAVLGDLVAAARHRVASGHGPRESAHAALPVRSMGETPTRYHISLDVADRPGVLARVAQVFAEHEVSIAAVRQRDRCSTASLGVVTPTALDATLRGTVNDLGALPVAP